MKIKFLLAMLTIVALSGCIATAAVPVISDISDSAVRVQIAPPTFGGEVDIQSVQAEANRGCTLYEKQAELLSSRCVILGDYGLCNMKEYLFSCK